ncbi:MAG: hypothetical protein ACPIOQ_36350, partial [Promethearchaeia archaeon]
MTLSDAGGVRQERTTYKQHHEGRQDGTASDALSTFGPHYRVPVGVLASALDCKSSASGDASPRRMGLRCGRQNGC